VARHDPTESGGLFVGAPREGRRGVRFRGTPERGGESRQRADETLAAGILVLELLLCLSLFGPQPLFWFWFGSQVQYWTGSVSAGLATILIGSITTLMVTVAIGKRVDEWWKLVRRAAGHEQRNGALERIFAVSVLIALAIFTFWFLIIQGPAPSVAPTN
jgi:hypothetical protein